VSDAPAKIAAWFAAAADQRLIRTYLHQLGYQTVDPAADPLAEADLYLLDEAIAARVGPRVVERKRQAEFFLPALIALVPGSRPAPWLAAGFDDCLRLPATKELVRARIEIMLRLRRQSEALGRKSESIHRALIESSSDQIFMLDAQGRYLASNDRVAHFGLTRGDELVGKAIEELFPNAVARRYRAQLDEVLASRTTVTFEHDHPTPAGLCYHLDTLYPIELPDGRVVVGGICRDITDRVRDEASRRLLETAIDHTVEAVFICDKENRITFANQAFATMTGHTIEDAAGHTPSLLCSRLQDPSRLHELKATIYGGHSWQGDLFLRRKDGSDYEVEATIAPICDTDGEVTHFVSIHRDVTLEHETERRMQQNQRLEAIGTLAGGIAHDFNNILSPIMGYTELCLGAVAPGSKVADYLDRVMLASGRATNLVRQILSFSRQSTHERAPMQLGPIIKEALKLLRASLPATIEIRQKIATLDEATVADPTEIHQIVMNLCTNAHHAMADGGLLTVGLQAVELAPEVAETVPSLSAGRYLKLSVGDTGSGIPKEIRDKIFEPYFTTKEEGRGTGLGLAVTHGIVTACDGAITVYSEPGEGTLFNLYFPAVPATPTTPARTAPKVPRGHEKILYVDDDPDIAQLGARMLEHHGYVVTSCTDPAQALALVREEPTAYALVVTDMTMPGMTGDRLAQAMLEVRPDLPIILCTGFSERINADKAIAIGIKRFMDKPVQHNDLALAVRQLLDHQE